MQHLKLKDVSNTQAIALMLLSASCWGLGTVMSKGILQYLSPFVLLVVQLSASVTFLWVAVIVRTLHSNPSYSPRPFLSWKIAKFGVAGLLEPGLAYTLGHIGLVMTTATNTLLINALEPIMVTALAWFVLGEQVGISLVFLSLIAIFGVLLSLEFDPELSIGTILGDVLSTLGTLCASLYAILSRHAVEKVKPVALAAIQQSFGLLWVVSLCLLLKWGNGSEIEGISHLIWLSAVASGLIHFGLAFWFYLSALEKLPASIASQFVMLIPIFGVCEAYLFLGEQLTPFQGFGMELTILALYTITQIGYQKGVVIRK